MTAETLFTKAGEDLKRGRSVMIPVKGDSMQPFLREGDSVILQRKGSYGPGDIVFARTYKPNRILLHRVIASGADILVVMGDANLKQREYCHIGDVAGYVTMTLRDGRWIDESSWRRRSLSGIWSALLPARRLLIKIHRLVCC